MSLNPKGLMETQFRNGQDLESRDQLLLYGSENGSRHLLSPKAVRYVLECPGEDQGEGSEIRRRHVLEGP